MRKRPVDADAKYRKSLADVDNLMFVSRPLEDPEWVELNDLPETFEDRVAFFREKAKKYPRVAVKTATHWGRARAYVLDKNRQLFNDVVKALSGVIKSSDGTQVKQVSGGYQMIAHGKTKLYKTEKGILAVLGDKVWEKA